MAVVSYRGLDGKRIRRSRLAVTREQARAKLAELKEETFHPTVVSEVKVAGFLRQWLADEVRTRRAENTYYNYRDECEKRIIPALGHLPVQELKAVHIHTLLADLGKANTGSRTLANVYTVLNTAMGFAIRMGVREGNPCEPVTKPQRNPKEIWPFTAEEANRILDATKEDRLHGLYVLALKTGMRQGELFGLRRKDVDFDEGKLSINWQVVECRGRIAVQRPKTKSSRRTVVLSATVISALEDRMRLAMAEGNAGSEQLFCTPGGKSIRRSNFGKRSWVPLLRRLSMKHRGFHHCRHTAATLMLSAGVPLHVVSRILGHSRPSITLDLYSHYMPSDGQSAADAVDKLLNSSSGG